MRYIQVPGPFEVREAASGRPIGRSCTFIESVRLVLVMIYQASGQQGAQRVKQSLLDDIEEAFENAKEGSWVALQDDTHKMLLDAISCPHPGVATAEWARSSKPHRRAVEKAVDTKPAEMTASDN